MYVEEIELRSSPGLPAPIHLRGLQPGLILVVGPNASGKSTLGRLLRGTLWPAQAPAAMDARTLWREKPGKSALQATLVFGQTGWDGDVTLPSHAASASWQLTLQDLLATAGRTDQSIAAEIQRQLDGGYDLAALTAITAHRLQPKRGLLPALRTSTAHLRAVLDSTDALQDDEARLHRLRLEVQAAANAPARAQAISGARERLRLQQQQADIDRHLAALPSLLARLPDGAADTAATLRKAIQDDGLAVARRAAVQAKLVVEVDGLKFSAGEPNQAQTQRWRRQAKQIVTLERDLLRLRTEATQTSARAGALAGQVWAGKVEATQPPLQLPPRAVLEQLNVAAHELAVASARLESVNRQELSMAVPSATPPSATQSATPSATRDALGLLRRWLMAPRQVTQALQFEPRSQLILRLMLAGLCLLGVGVALAVAVALWPGLSIAGLGVGVLGLALGLRTPPETVPADAVDIASTQAETIAKRYVEQGHEPPNEWTTVAIEAQIDRLEHQLSVAAAAELQQNAARQRRRRWQHDLQAAREIAQRRTERLHGLALSLGMNADFPALALIIQANRVIELGDAQLAAVASAETLAHAERAYHAAARGLREELLALALTTLSRLDDADALLDCVEQVAARRVAGIDAGKRRDRATVELQTAQQGQADAVEQHSAFIARCGVPPTEAHRLDALGVQRSQWLTLRTDHDVVSQRIAVLDRELPVDLPSNAVVLETEYARLQALGQRLEALQAEISTIEQRLTTATDGSSVEVALRACDKAKDALLDDRGLAQAGHGAATLLTWLRDHRSQEDTPGLLRRARAWFLRFTRRRYELQVNLDGTFRALDLHTQRHQSLAQLSSGTRVQLLLAARLAFIEEGEQGGAKMPLFLDEVLSTTDPARFEQVAIAVLELAAEGRQVFYATADPSEIQAFSAVAAQEGFAPPQVCTLTGRDQSAPWKSAAALLQPRPAQQPWPGPPASGDVHAYLTTLGLPRPRLHDSAKTWPLLLLLYDHLDVARQAAEVGLTHAGQLLVSAAGVPLILEPEIYRLAAARLTVVETTLLALRVGRDRAVTWAMVQASDAVSQVWADRVRAVLRRSGHDATAFLADIGALSGFRRQKREELQDFLEDQGVIDARPTLSRAQIITRATQSSLPAVAAKLLTLHDIDRLVGIVEVVVLESSQLDTVE